MSVKKPRLAWPLDLRSTMNYGFPAAFVELGEHGSVKRDAFVDGCRYDAGASTVSALQMKLD